MLILVSLFIGNASCSNNLQTLNNPQISNEDMNQNELRELNTWIAEHVMGWIKCDVKNLDHSGRFSISDTGFVLIHAPRVQIKQFRPTTDTAAAFEVLKKCLDNQREFGFGDPCFISKDGGYWLRAVKDGKHIDGEAETLELAICLFAKKIFTKPL